MPRLWHRLGARQSQRHFAQPRRILRTGPPRCSCNPSVLEQPLWAGPGPRGGRSKPPIFAPGGLAPRHARRAQVWSRLMASPAACCQAHLGGACVQQKADARPATTWHVSFESRSPVPARHARTPHSATCARPPRSLTHVRTTYKPHQSPPTCLRPTYQHLVHGPAREIGPVRLSCGALVAAQNRACWRVASRSNMPFQLASTAS